MPNHVFLPLRSQPWPVSGKSLTIGWQRGKQLRGATRPAIPQQGAAQGSVVKFNEVFTVPVTLYKVRTGVVST